MKELEYFKNTSVFEGITQFYAYKDLEVRVEDNGAMKNVYFRNSDDTAFILRGRISGKIKCLEKMWDEIYLSIICDNENDEE